MAIAKTVMCVLLAASGVAGAAEHLVEQKDRKFSSPYLTIHPSDSIRFTNKDDIVHNVVSTTSGNEFNLGVFRPGMSQVIEFHELGAVDVECTIHPNMRMSVFIFK